MTVQMPPEAQTRLYLRSLGEISNRLTTVRQLADRAGTPAAEPYDEEVCALYLRKVAELIGFGSLTANKALYAAAYNDFAKEWRLWRLFERLEKIHPQFYPRPVVAQRLPDQGGIRRFHFDFLQRGFMTRDALLDLYQQCSQGIHSPNPFAVQASFSVTDAAPQWIREIELLLSFHQIRFADTPGLWIVEYCGPDGRAHVYSALPGGTGTS